MLANFDKLEGVFSSISTFSKGIVVGTIPLRDNDNNILIEYRVSINFNKEYPEIKELEELIPHDIERHVYPNNDWALCLGYPISLVSFWTRTGFDCILYIKKKLIPYLANQYYFDRNGEWLVAGLSHGTEGTLGYIL